MMRGMGRWVLLWLLLAGAGWAEPQKRVTRSYVRADIVDVVKELARDMNRNVFGCESG